MTRVVDLLQAALQRISLALSTLSRDYYGLPITLTGATAVAANGSAVLTITVPTDSYVRSLSHRVLITATGAQALNARLDRIDVAGFQIWDCQTALDPHLVPVIGAGAAAGAGGIAGQVSPLQTVGFPKGFRLRQGDTIEFTFTSNNAAATRGSIQVDAFRVDQIKPA
jgi:hypothetical protein